MKLDKLSIHCLNIPFVEGFGHATKDRRFSDAIVVEIHALGQRGYGEALPRDYVTGETTESVVEHLQTRVWPQLAGRSLDGSNTATLLVRRGVTVYFCGTPKPKNHEKSRLLKSVSGGGALGVPTVLPFGV
jgi:L-alanine-DL-glutamate epimerase-like enolase superfamily enzyme